jgi:hypothetical protein
VGITGLILLYFVSVVVAFVGWYACGPISRRSLRAIARATLIAAFCAPGVLIGHGLGVAPTAFALYAQPSVFTLASIGLVWFVALGIVFAIPPLREHRNNWPPSASEIFIRGYPVKFVLFGVMILLIVAAALNFDTHRETLVGICIFFVGAMVNFTLCYWAVRLHQARAYVTPAYFAVPSLLGQIFVLGFFWYGCGLTGALVGTGKRRVASWVSLVVTLPMTIVSLERAYSAAHAPSHVVIGGGVAGNLAMAIAFVAIGAAGWWFLRRN